MSGGLSIIVVTEDLAKAASLVQLLSASHHRVIAIDFDQALVEITHQAPDVLVVDVATGEALGHLRRLACAIPKSIYVISIISGSLPGRACASAVAAGSHDVICEPYGAAELHARVDVHRRLRGWAVEASSRHATKAPANTLAALRAWDYLGVVVADDLEAMFGQPLEVAERWISVGPGSRLATIAMTQASAQLELCVSIVADRPALAWLGQTLLGDAGAPCEAIDDVLRELANTAGGALKRAALVEGPVLSTGIPRPAYRCRVATPVRGAGRCRSMARSLAVMGHQRRRANRRVGAKRLMEGMVVVSDVRNQAGVLLLPSGTRLTMTTAQRLSNLLDCTEIDVAA